MGNGKVLVRGIFLVMALLIPVMVQAHHKPGHTQGPPAGSGKDTKPRPSVPTGTPCWAMVRAWTLMGWCSSYCDCG
jgi:hypothetical protein